MIPIPYREILEAGEIPPEEQALIEEQLDNLANAQDLLTDSFA